MILAVLVISVGLLLVPEYLLLHTTLVTKLIPGDVWNRIKSRLAVAWIVLFMVYLRALGSRADARQR